MKIIRLSALCLAVAALSSAASAADDPGQFYANKSIEVVISYSPGGGYDTYGRLMARYIVQHIPGRPRVVVKNMPGAGGLVGANYLYNVAKRDGSVLGEVNENVALGQVLGTKGIKYDARKFTWIGRIISNISVFHTWQTSKAKTIDDVFKYETIAGGTGPTSNSVIMPRLLNALLGTRFKVVTGYKGSSAVTLAMEKGEVDGSTRPWSVIKAKQSNWVRDRKINLLVQLSLTRHPDLSNVPTVVDLAKTKEQRQILSLLVSGSAMGRSLMAPPEVPSARAAILRAAFDKAMTDPKFLAETKKRKLEIDPAPASKLIEVVQSAFEAPAAVVKKTAELVNSAKKKSGKKKSAKKK